MDLMIDIETLGTSDKAPVISIGACFFDKRGIKERFYAVLDISEQIDSGKRITDASTIKWWMGQEGAAKKVFRDDVGVVLQEINQHFGGLVDPMKNGEILARFVQFCKQYENVKPWGNGSNFDITILENLFQSYRVKIPWNFRNIRDLRTFKEYVYDGSQTERVGTHHNALDDALYQAQVVIDGLNDRKTKQETKNAGILKKCFGIGR